MRKLSSRRHQRRGAAIVEFSLALTFLVPMLLGTFVFGFRLVRALDMQQITGDLSHMYIKGSDFRSAGPTLAAKTLSSGFDLTTNGSSVLMFSKIRLLLQADCDAANPGKPAGTACTNLNNPVFTELVKVGNSSLQVNGSTARSAFGIPPVQADFTVLDTDQANTASASAGSTAALTGFASLLALKAGETAYMVEMYNTTTDLNIKGLTGSPQVYARTIY